MANNRIYLVCKVCGDYYAIAKYYPDTGWYSNGGDNLIGFEDFLEKHSNHRKEKGCDYLYDNEGGDIFTMVHESDDIVEEINFETRKIKLKKVNL